MTAPTLRPGRSLRRAITTRRQVIADGDPGRDSYPQARCPFLLRAGDRTCKSGCWEEPSCYTDMPLRGWPKPWQIGDHKRRTPRRR